MELALAIYAALVSTFVAALQWRRWRTERVGILLNIWPRVHDVKPDRFSHIEVDIQASNNKTEIRGVYLAAYRSRWHWLLGKDPAEALGNDWMKIFPQPIEPGNGWEGLMAINDGERALAARHSHVRVVVRHAGRGRVVSKPVTKILRR